MTASTSTTGTPAGGVSQYTFANADAQGPLQLELLADILDDHTTEVLAAAGTGTGIPTGWQCLDVGSGAGTITAWLSDQVGPGGHVTALDLDPHHVRAADNVTICRADIRTVALPERQFDLVHTRLVLLHLAERDLVLDRLVTALKPGGILVVSDWDGTWRDWLLHTLSHAAADAFHAFQSALLAVLEDNGADLGWARRAPLAMRAAGLVDVDTVVHNRLWAGGQAGCLLHASNSHQLHDALLGRGVTPTQLDLLREAMRNPTTLAYCYPMFTTTGRRPKN
jgi:SAM-dependent methyltransferase